MNRNTFRLVLLVSCAHALVHVFELALPSVELGIAEDYGVGRQVTGLLSTCWRMPWGLGALAAGWLVDRYGSERMLAIFLIGCALTCVVVGLTVPLPLMFVTMFAMGTFACIYHPAGLALISHNTTLDIRPRALGVHGIFGSLGLGLSPLLAALLLTIGFTWQQYYLLLAAPGFLLGLIFLRRAFRSARVPVSARDHPPLNEQTRADWKSFGMLTMLALMQGFVYAAVLSFLPRFLGSWEVWGSQLSQATRGSYLTAGVLVTGCLGQYVAGRIARPQLLEIQLTLITLANVPALLAMAFAQDGMRAAAAVLFAIVHFMHQPLYNSLIAKYTPPHRRSLSYGLSFAIGAGLGSLGAAFNGFVQSDVGTYTTLAAAALVGGLVGLILWRRNAAAE
jgi:FSR family fosmidomycin resistance protein-like MFS transporter